jgi:hypothetical protein
MRQLVVIGALAAAFGTGVGYAQTPLNTAGQNPVPSKPVTLATGVRIPRAVEANGQPLKAGTYTVRLLGQALEPALGETPGLEQWVEFLQKGKVEGKAIASVVPANEIHQIAKEPVPAPGHFRVNLLKGDNYLRVWINRAGASYLIHLSTRA